MRTRRSRFAPLATLVFLLSAGSFCVEQTEDKPTDEDMKVVKANLLTTAPTPKHVVNADLEGKLTYLGCDVDPEPIEPGRDVKVVHYWKVVTPPGDGWRMFTHVNGPGGKSNFTNFDHGPVRGKYPVSQWKAGQIIRDEHTVRLPGSWPHNKMDIYVGIWKGGTRLVPKSGPHDNDNRVLAATVAVASKAPPPPRKKYIVRKASKAPKIDGKLDDDAWKDVPSTGPFVNTMSGAPVEQRTEAKLLWDAKFLYLAFDVQDADIWSNLVKRDDKLWTQEAVEIMLDADGDGKTYVELQVAPNGTVFDTYLPEYRKYEDSIDPKKAKYSWDAKMQVKVHVDGTVNKREDQDKSWTVEMAIPLDDVKGMAAKGPKLPPTPGDVWRANFFRMDMPQGKSQQASGWSPPMVGDFHALDKFGELVFGDEKGTVPALAAGAAPVGPSAAPGTNPGGRPFQLRQPILGPGMPALEPGMPQLELPNATRPMPGAGAKGGAAKGDDKKTEPGKKK